jgi:hypothetical protein
LIARIVAETSGHSATLVLDRVPARALSPCLCITSICHRILPGCHFCFDGDELPSVLVCVGLRWSDLSVRNVVNSVNRSVNIAYDNGLRRLNDLKNSVSDPIKD